MSLPLADLNLTAADLARFHALITPIPGTDCLIWTGELNGNGYGRFTLYRAGKRVRVLAHRLAYFLATGHDPGPLDTRHDCDVPLCCNAEHLQSGTRAENMRDAEDRGRANRSGLRAATADRTARRLQLLAAGFKKCSRCKETKPIRGFNRNRREEDGLQNECRPCKKVSDHISVVNRITKRGRRK